MSQDNTKRSPSYEGFPQLKWDIISMKDHRLDTKHVPRTWQMHSYPARLLRYWYMYHLIERERMMHSHQLRVCEIGSGICEMLRYLGAVNSVNNESRVEFDSWIGIEKDENKVKQVAGIAKDLGYSDLIVADAEDVREHSSWWKGSPDVVMLLHVIEHFEKPEDTLREILGRMKAGSVMIGGFPSHVHKLVKYREAQYKKILEQGHQKSHRTAWSKNRIKEFAAKNMAEVEIYPCAYLLRLGGTSKPHRPPNGVFGCLRKYRWWRRFSRWYRRPLACLEDHKWWHRFNVWCGSICPWCPTECYWVIRKPGVIPRP